MDVILPKVVVPLKMNPLSKLMNSIKPSRKGIYQSAFITIPFSIVLAVFLLIQVPGTQDIRPAIFCLAISLLPAMACAWEFFTLISTQYKIQPNSLKIEKSFFSSTTQNIASEKINSLQVIQNPLDRLLRIGNIHITTSSGEQVILHSLPNPHETADLIEQMRKGGN